MHRKSPLITSGRQGKKLRHCRVSKERGEMDISAPKPDGVAGNMLKISIRCSESAGKAKKRDENDKRSNFGVRFFRGFLFVNSGAPERSRL